MRLSKIKLKHWSKLYHYMNGNRTLCGLLPEEKDTTVDDVPKGYICSKCHWIKKSHENSKNG